MSGMRQLAGPKTTYRRAHAAPLAGLISGRAEYKVTAVLSFELVWGVPRIVAASAFSMPSYCGIQWSYDSLLGNREVWILIHGVNDIGRRTVKTREPVSEEKFCAISPV